MKLITKVILLIVILMTPVIVLYAYSNRQSTELVEKQITIANQNRLAIFMNQIEGEMEQVSQYSNLISRDPDFAELAGNVIPGNGYDYAVLLDAQQRKLQLFSLSTAWMNRISLYFPGSGHAVSSYSLMDYDERYLQDNLTTKWDYREVKVTGIAKMAFTRFFVEPSSAQADLTKASMVVEINLMAENIVTLLDSFKSRGNNDPFLYRGPDEYLLNGSADEPFIRRILDVGAIAAVEQEQGYDVFSIDGERYLVYSLPSEKLGWKLIDYVPLEDILSPVTESRNLFYLTAALLILMGAGAAFLIYSQVQVPIRLLGEGSGRLEQGELSARIQSSGNRDFRQLFGRFNRMAERMQYLIEKVFSEELRAKEAVMRQLQAQINPHFLYNSLAYIVSMAQLNRTEPVISMAYSLADYYRYTTRTDQPDTTVQDELAFVVSYIEIMDMQLRKIRFEIDLPEALEAVVIPKLLFQPIVENAIQHGLEPKLGNGLITVSGGLEDGRIRFAIEDDGVGLTDERIAALNEVLTESKASADSFGLWNVAERLRLRFGETASLTLERSPAGGVRAVLSWPAAATSAHLIETG